MVSKSRRLSTRSLVLATEGVRTPFRAIFQPGMILQVIPFFFLSGYYGERQV